MSAAAGSHAARLARRLERRTARIAIAGLGYVGLPLALEFCRAGFRVLGIDVNRARVASLAAGRSHVQDVTSAALAEFVDSGRLTFQDRYAGCGRADAVLICVPTPLCKTRDPDMSYIVAAVDAIAAQARAGQLIVLESTTYPGTTEEIVRPRLEARGLRAGRDVFLAFSPERVDPGNPRFRTRNTPKIVGGITPACTRLAAQLYAQAVDSVRVVSSTRAAEMIKLLENTFRAVNIGLVNELALICERLSLDVWEVIDGAATKPFGFMPFYPGPGIGGHCIPLDPHYLSWKLRTLNYQARFIELAAEVNGGMPEVVVRRAAELLNRRHKSVNGSRIFLLGMAYKRDTGDVRESPALDILRLLEEQGAKVAFHDPYNASVRLEGGALRKGSRLGPAALRRADLVLVVTDHSSYDWRAVVRDAALILDTRNATRSVRTGRHKIHKL